MDEGFEDPAYSPDDDEDPIDPDEVTHELEDWEAGAAEEDEIDWADLDDACDGEELRALEESADDADEEGLDEADLIDAGPRARTDSTGGR